MNLTASVICKNELGRFLEPCIGHLLDFCDQIVILDDGSSDGTADWLYDQAEQDDRVVVQFLDRSDGFFEGHEGRKRQALIDFTLNQKPEWVLSIDADEFVANGHRLRQFCEQPQRRLVGSLVMEEIWEADIGGLRVRQDGGWRPHPIPCLWHAGLDGQRGQRLRILDRALACGREPEQVRRLASRARGTGTSVMHFGWANPSQREGRYQRYVTADGGRFHRNAHLESIMWPAEKVQLGKTPWPAGLVGYRDAILERTNAHESA